MLKKVCLKKIFFYCFIKMFFGDCLKASEISLNSALYYDELHPEHRSKKTKLDYVLNKYELTVENRKCLFFPAKNPKRLVISFCYAVSGRYAMWSWFWNDDENWEDTAYLFLRDDYITWYLGTNEAPAVDTFSKIIKYFIDIAGVEKQHVITMGISMGGYGAIYYATLLGLKGAIADVPQIDKESFRIYHSAWNLRPNIAWIDLDKFVAESKNTACVSLLYGNDSVDYLASYKLIDVLKQRNSTFIVRKVPKQIHQGNVTKAFIESEINYLDNLIPFNSYVFAE